MEYRDDVRYRDSHEWVRIDGSVATIGISDYAQDSLGDVVFVELPEKGKEFKQGDAFGVVESVKAASDIYAPVDGTILEVNGELEDSPNLVNEAPFEKGWICTMEIKDPAQFEGLMTASSYKEYAEGLDE